LLGEPAQYESFLLLLEGGGGRRRNLDSVVSASNGPERKTFFTSPSGEKEREKKGERKRDI